MGALFSCGRAKYGLLRSFFIGFFSSTGWRKGDYKIVPVGATPFRLERMINDPDVAACIMNLPYRLMAVEAGLSVMCEATDQIGPYPFYSRLCYAPLGAKKTARPSRGTSEPISKA